ncbi:MAG TPA: sialidase family protein [Gemmatimonadaceae bacterium]|nr:sialidase family protein [Gemmatimonadaceae bacterium]
MNVLRNAGCVAACVLAVSCGARTPRVTLAVPGRTNQFATVAARGDFVAVAWAATANATTDIYVATSRDGGTSFGAPVRVNATEGDARVAGEQPPQVVLTSGDGSVVVVWPAKRAEGSRLLTARSTDGGKTFGETSVVTGTEAAGNRGWESLAIDSAGRTMVVWLDHRNAAASMAMSHEHGGAATHAMKMDPNEKAEQSQVMFGIVGDTSATRVMSTSVCYCCKTSVAVRGRMVVAAWRHVYPGSQRDIALAVSHDGGATFSEPHRVSEDHWAFDGCPENGPSVAIDSTQRIHVVWPTPRDGTPDAPLTLFHATSADGATFTPRQALTSSGAALHIRILVAPDGTTYSAWEEPAQNGPDVHLARLGDAMKTVTLRGNYRGSYPAIAAVRNGLIMTWAAEGSGISVVRLAP